VIILHYDQNGNQRIMKVRLGSSVGRKILRFFDSEGYSVRDDLCVRTEEDRKPLSDKVFYPFSSELIMCVDWDQPPL